MTAPTPRLHRDRDQGFQIVDGVLDPDETMALLQAIEEADLTRGRGGARHLMREPAVAAMAHDPRLLAVAETFVGRAAVPYRATLFDKSPARNWLVTWHQDTALPLEARRDQPGWGPWSIKSGIAYAHAPAAALERIVALRLHIDDSRADNGPLRVLPGTHASGLLTDDQIQQRLRQREPVDCLVSAGGLIAMRPLILHASSKATADRPRRVLHIEYAETRDIGDGLRLAIA